MACARVAGVVNLAGVEAWSHDQLRRLDLKGELTVVHLGNYGNL